MKAIVIYFSNYGCTQAYAEKIATETGGKSLSVQEAKKLDFSEYDTVIFGSCVMAGRIAPKIAKFITKNWSKLQGKKLAVYTTSDSMSQDGTAVKAWEASVDEAIRKNFSYHNFGGRKNVEEARGLHKLVFNMMKAESTDHMDLSKTTELVSAIS